MRVCDVPTNHLDVIWPHARPFIAAALKRDGSGRFLPVDILNLLLAERAKLWVSWDPARREVEAAIITQLIEFPRARECHIWLVGGRNMKTWVNEARDMIEAFARGNGCRIVSGGLRRGWIRIGGEGWRETGVTFEKRL